MATNFPTSLDNLTNPTGSSSLTSPDHAGQHTDANDAIEALQAKVGVNSSAVTTSLDYKVRINTPSGAILPYAGSSAPTGWLLCDGSLVSTTTYASLFAVIGYTYGSSGATFQLPDLRGRVPVGKAPSGTFGTLGGSGGVETVTLTGAQSGVPAHSHTITDNGHSHNLPYVYGASGGTVGMLVSGVTTLGQLVGSSTTGISVNNNTAANAASAHTNLQPYIVLNYIIKT